ncbi:MAG: hypothetical protein GY753_02010 [Gammaproteobacteria bacterium]|nr:hypothetical protein [Gammaproteobacteria bacterium]
MNNIQSNHTTSNNRRFTGKIMRASLLMATLVVFAPSAWAEGEYGFHVENQTSDDPIHSVTSEVECLIGGYTGDETIEPNNHAQYYIGTSNVGSSPFDDCAYSKSKIRYSFRDVNDTEFAHITVEDPNGSGSWRITSSDCDVSDVDFGNCTLPCSDGDVYRDNNWDDPYCLYVW